MRPGCENTVWRDRVGTLTICPGRGLAQKLASIRSSSGPRGFKPARVATGRNQPATLKAILVGSERNEIRAQPGGPVKGLRQGRRNTPVLESSCAGSRPDRGSEQERVPGCRPWSKPPSCPSVKNPGAQTVTLRTLETYPPEALSGDRQRAGERHKTRQHPTGGAPKKKHPRGPLPRGASKPFRN